MLMPLETLPGWPRVANPSPLESLGLLIGLPLVVIVLAFGIAKIGNLAKASRAGSDGVTDPVWVGGPTRPEIEGPLHDEASSKSRGELIETDEESVGTGGPVVREHDDAETGGAGARW